MPRVDSESEKIYRAYRLRILRDPIPVMCSLCSPIDVVPFKVPEYLKHLKEVHKLEKKRHCPWCHEEFRQIGLFQNANHLADCYRQFKISKFGLCKEEPMEIQSDANDPPACDCIHFESCNFNRQLSNVFSHKLVKHFELNQTSNFNFLNTIHIKDCKDWHVVQNRIVYTEESGLGSEAVQYLLKYIELESEVEWFHLMVSACTFPSFAEEFKEFPIHFLPYGCLCFGSSKVDARPDTHIHHRHLIAVAKKCDLKWFKKIWNQVCMPLSERCLDLETCKRHLEVNSQSHFCNVLNYVSQTKSNCKGLLEPESRWENNCHYNIERPIMKHSVLALCLLWENGIQTFLHQRIGNSHIDAWSTLQKRTIGRRRRWTAKIGEVFHGIQNCSLPLGDNLIPSGEIVTVETMKVLKLQDPSLAYWFLPHSKVMLLKRDERLNEMSLKDRERLQKEAGNQFMEVLKDEYYVLSKRQSYCANQLCKERKRHRNEIDRILYEHKQSRKQLETEHRNETVLLRQAYDERLKEREDELLNLHKQNTYLMEQLKVRNPIRME